VLSVNVQIDEDTVPFEVDDDPSDEVASEDAPGVGIVIRTDFSNEVAWSYFIQKLEEGEAEFSAATAADEDEPMVEDPSPSSNIPNASSSTNPEEESDDDDDSSASPIFTILNPSSDSPLRAYLTNATNLSALRLLNDISVRAAPPLPADIKRHKPANRLIDHDGWQEVYEGKMLWIYDAKSNTDGCARVVSQRSAGYGTATADSWRARVTHICELQVNLASGAMSIDFGGLDRYDYEERMRNLQEAERGLV